MLIAQTPRLTLRQFTLADAKFIFRLVNEPAWLRFIGDRGIRTLADAEAYLTNGPLASYARQGFGLYAVELTASATPIGMCGLIKRDSLPEVDMGYALLPEFWGQGYATEAARAVVTLAQDTLGLTRLMAIVSPDNAASIKVLEKLGMRFQRQRQMPGDSLDTHLFLLDTQTPSY